MCTIHGSAAKEVDGWRQQLHQELGVRDLPENSGRLRVQCTPPWQREATVYVFLEPKNTMLGLA